MRPLSTERGRFHLKKKDMDDICGKKIDSVWEYRAVEPGPAAAIVGGVHGNERAGIRVIETLRRLFDDGALVPRRGAVFLALGNPRAIAAGVRAEGEDLNRCFTGAVLAGEGGAYAHRRARELAEAFKDVRFGIDIHGTNTPSRPFLVIQGAARAGEEVMLRCLSASMVLRDPRLVFAGEPSTLDELFSRDDGLGVCYETGAAGDESGAGRIVSEVIGALRAGGWLSGPASAGGGPLKDEYVLKEAIVMAPAGFRFAPGVGDENFQPVGKGRLIGFHGEAPLVAGEDGLLVFPKPERFRAVGQPVGYLAVPSVLPGRYGPA